MSTRVVAVVQNPQRSRIEARTEAGQPIAMDGDPPEGDDSAASPKEVLLASLAACTGMDVAAILRKKRQTAATYEITVEGESAEEHPKVFVTIDVEHRLTGAVEPEALRRAIELSATRYCPVSAMLSRSAQLEHRYRLNGDAPVLVAVTGPDGNRVL